MYHASIHRTAGRWPREKAAGSLTLDFDTRHRRRVRVTTDQGEGVILDLPKAVAMTDGDGLRLEDGRWLKVQAAPELIAEVRHRDLNELIRIAWHLGNRHLPIETRDQVLRIRPDHVIEDMLRGFGADLRRCKPPSNPRAGPTAPTARDHNNYDSEHHHG